MLRVTNGVIEVIYNTKLLRLLLLIYAQNCSQSMKHFLRRRNFVGLPHPLQLPKRALQQYFPTPFKSGDLNATCINSLKREITPAI